MDSCYSNQNSFYGYFDENKFITFLTSFTFIVIFIFIYILRAYTFFDKRHISRAVNPSAPFGNIKDVLFQDTSLYVYLWKYYNKFKRKQLKFGGLYLFFKPSLLIIDPLLMQAILKEQRFVSDVSHRKSFFQDGGVVDLFTNDNLEDFLIKYNLIKDSLFTDLNDRNISSTMHNFFMETTSVTFGFKTSLKIRTIVNSLLSRRVESNFKYYLGLVYPLFQRNDNLSQEMETILKDIVDYRKKNDVRETDFMQSFIDLSNKGGYDIKEIAPDIFNMFVDNVIYSYSSLIFCLYELASNKDVRQNLLQEIRSFNKEDMFVHLKALTQFPYLDAIVKETLRKYPPIPTIIKQNRENWSVDGFDLQLPKGTYILYSIMGVHRDSVNYLQPNKFDPDRFIKQCEPKTYNPFGFDAQQEIGLRLTTLHIKLGLISILSSYNVNLSNKYYLEFDNKKLPIYPKEPLPITLEPI